MAFSNSVDHLATKDKFVEEITWKLKRMGYHSVADSFEAVVSHPATNDDLEKADVETTEKFMNKHGVIHGLTVAHRILSLFELVHNGDIDSDYTKGPEEKRLLRDKSDVLFCLLTAAYIHDIGRFYDPEVRDHQEHVSLGVDRTRDDITSGRISSAELKSRPSDVLERIRELCLCHENKDTPSNVAEIALIKVADTLDCSKKRAYQTEEVSELKHIHNECEARRIIFSRDQHPEDYFGCCSVQDVEVKYEPDEGIVDVTLSISDYAAAKPIKTLVKALKSCRLGRSDSTRQLSRRIRVYVREPAKGEYLIYPEDTTDIQWSPYAETTTSRSDVDIQDMSGTTKMTDLYTVRNVGRKGLRSRVMAGEGIEATEWDDITGKAASVTIIDDEKELEEKEADIHYMYGEERNYPKENRRATRHWWKVVFREGDEVPPGKSCRVKMECIWPGWCNVQKDEILFSPLSPYDTLEVNIYFPTVIREQQISAHQEIRDRITTIWEHDELLRPAFDHNKDKLSITALFKQTKPGYAYGVVWQVTKND